jgi:hypothetical protein
MVRLFSGVVIFLLWWTAPASGHEIYSKWAMPDQRSQNGLRNMSCCSGKDCYMTSTRRQDGQWQYLHRETGQWLVIPKHKIEQNYPDEWESPDGRSHVCALPSGLVLCATLGSGS